MKNSNYLKALQQQNTDHYVPVWFLRQAGLVPLHGDGEPHAAHAHPATQDGSSLDIKSQVHHQHP